VDVHWEESNKKTLHILVVAEPINRVDSKLGT